MTPWSAIARQRREQLERDYRAGRVLVYPERITMTLDARGLYGPEVDRACLAAEPAVDLWEQGKARPTWEQLVALADLVGFTPEFLCKPGSFDGPGFICGPAGCEPLSPPESVEPFDPAAGLADVVPMRRRA